MDDTRFDSLTRGLESRLTRRRAGGLAAGALLALGLAAESDAKKKKKKKKKKGGSGSAPAPAPAPTVNYSCANVGARCGNTLVCQCRLDTASQQVCLNEVVGTFQPCQSTINCPAGSFCDLASNRCGVPCAN
ncbi:MAG: hypothetical protein QM692_05945 [Thermomicrobiales bacterium]